MNIQKNVSLKEHNTFGIDKKAKYFTQVSSVQEVIKAIEEAEKLNVPLLVLGGGSNILLTKDVEGLVMKMSIKGVHLVKDTTNHVYVKVGAGEVWHDFVLHAIGSNWAGIENLSLIPGTVGASPMQNIGAYGVEIKEVFNSLEAVNIQSKKTETFDHAACKFGYRDSIFKNEAKGKYVITHVTFKLNKNACFNTSYGAIRSTLDQMDVRELSLEAISQAVIAIRQSKLPDPKTIGNAGSFFKNPTLEHSHYLELQRRFPTIPGFTNKEGIKVPAAWLLEQAGWKGKTFDKIGVHKDQPLVLVNYGGGDGEAIRHLSEEIRQDIQAKFNIILHPEVNFI